MKFKNTDYHIVLTSVTFLYLFDEPTFTHYPRYLYRNFSIIEMNRETLRFPLNYETLPGPLPVFHDRSNFFTPSTTSCI